MAVSAQANPPRNLICVLNLKVTLLPSQMDLRARSLVPRLVHQLSPSLQLAQAARLGQVLERP